jgi:hypothetical protein
VPQNYRKKLKKHKGKEITGIRKKGRQEEKLIKNNRKREIKNLGMVKPNETFINKSLTT